MFSDLDNPPFAEVGADGVPRGRDVEMMKDIARILERPLEWRRLPFDQLLPAAARGEAEVVCATLGVTPERERQVAFSRPYFVTSIAVVVRSGEGEPRRLGDLSGRRVAAAAGTTSERALRQRLPDCTPVLENEAQLSAAERLLAGEVDALVMDAPNAEALVREGAGRMQRLDESLAVESYALALPRSERATLARGERRAGDSVPPGQVEGTGRELRGSCFPNRGDELTDPLKMLAALALICAGCRAAETGSASEGSTLFYNGRIYLGDESWTRVEALLAVDGRVEAVGGREELLGRATGASSFDLRGAVVVPGLQDAHVHLEEFGASLESVDLRGASSFDEVVERIARQAARQAPGTWVLGRGWDQNLWPEEAFPHHRRLSERVPDHPVWVQRVDGHAALANASALAVAGLTEADSSQLTDGAGRVIAGEDGRPSGVFVDAAMDLVARHVPPPDRATRARRILRGQDAFIAAGLTAVHDMGVDPETVDVLLELKQAGRLKLRCIEYVTGNQGLTPFVLASFPMRAGSRDLISVIGVKLVIDGALGSRGAALLEEYSDQPGEKGLLLLSPEELAQRLEQCAQAGLQPAVHAIGDRANRVVLDCLRSADVGRPDLRAPASPHRARPDRGRRRTGTASTSSA